MEKGSDKIIEIRLNHAMQTKVQKYIDYMNQDRREDEREWDFKDAIYVLFAINLEVVLRGL